MEQPANDTTGKEASLANTNHPPVETELVAQVAALETDAQQIDDSEVQAKVQQLVKLIRTTLKSQTLSRKTQKELARLLSLLSNLDNRHIQQLNLLDLAVSILLEPDDSKPTDSSAQGLLNRTRSEAKNLTFVQETRRQVAHQSRAYPDVIRAIITGSGTPYIRLITGLTWFFVLFVLTPVTVSGLIFAATKLPNNQENEDLRKLNAALVADAEGKDEQIATLTSRNNALIVNLERTSRLLPKASEAEISRLNASAPSAEPLAPAANSPATNPSPNTPTAASTVPNSASSQPTPEAVIPVKIQTLNNIQSEIAKGLEEDAQQAAQSIRTDANIRANEANADSNDSSKSPGTANNPPNSQQNPPAESSSGASVKLRDGTETLTFDVLPIRTGPWPIALAVSIGALGGTVSVIVRANTFIRQAQASENDLFLTGFFRPFVGMSFAIFCVALVEAGVFSGIFDLTNRDEADRTYFYIAIAFVAGFSERLVRDVVIKTEDTLAGPKTVTPTDL